MICELSKMHCSGMNAFRDLSIIPFLFHINHLIKSLSSLIITSVFLCKICNKFNALCIQFSNSVLHNRNYSTITDAICYCKYSIKEIYFYIEFFNNEKIFSENKLPDIFFNFFISLPNK